MLCSNLFEKAYRKLRKIIFIDRYGKSRKYLYSSYIHMILSLKKNDNDLENLYFAANPNPGAGIGHQMANWIAGYWFAKMFKIKFAHIPFSSKEWEEFLGFGEDEETVENLKKQGYKCVRIPLFIESITDDISMVERIIKSYSGRKIVFLAEQDQFYKEQYGVKDEIQQKFYNAKLRKNQTLLYEKDKFNVAVHIRRGDIVQGESNENLSMRFQDNEYFINALYTALECIKTDKEIHVFVFSQGKEEDYPEFQMIDNIHFCLDMTERDSFLHMVYADAIITSKSSFSYKPALLNRGLKFCPKNFWHGYPDEDEWFLLEENGKIYKGSDSL